MSSAMPNMFGRSLNILSVFFWNMSPAGAALNGSFTDLYLPTLHATIVSNKMFH